MDIQIDKFTIFIFLYKTKSYGRFASLCELKSYVLIYYLKLVKLRGATVRF